MALTPQSATALEFKLAAFPFVLVRFPQTVDRRTLAQLRAMQERIFMYKQRYVSIVDLRGTDLMPNASIRREASHWTKAQEPLLQHYQVANALVVGSAIIRAALVAAHWFAPPPMPTIVCGTFAQAARFLMTTAGERGLTLTGPAQRELEGLAKASRS